MRNLKKKGFTIVELVIVIAVIAVLAAVLIPTFVNLTKKANQSADIQAVRQINTLLSTYEVEGKPKNVYEVITLLSQDNIDLDDYKPLSSGHFFYWVSSKNRIVLADESNNVVYPTNEGITYVSGDWYALYGEVPMNEDFKPADGYNSVEVSNAADFVGLINNINNGRVTGLKEIKLTKSIDLMGSSINYSEVTGTVKLYADPADNVVISGIRADINSVVHDNPAHPGEKKGYGYGLFGYIGDNAKVTIENITLKGIVVGNSDGSKAGHFGIIAGLMHHNSSLTVTNVKLIDCTVYGADKAGAVAGYMRTGSKLTIDGLTTENVTVLAGALAAKVVGAIEVNSNSKFTVANSDFSGVTTGLNPDQFYVTGWGEGKDPTIYPLSNSKEVVYDNGLKSGVIKFGDKWYSVYTDGYYYKNTGHQTVDEVVVAYYHPYKDNIN